MENLLLNEYPLIVLPGLAKRIGLNEAIVLQQIHYWVKQNERANRNHKDSYYWTYNTYEEWQEQFPFWSTRTIQRATRSLREKGLIITGSYNKMGNDNTNWYRIDYGKLVSIEEQPENQPRQSVETATTK